MARAWLLVLAAGVYTGWWRSVEGVCIVPKCCPVHQTFPAAGKGCENSSLEFEPEFWNGAEAVKGSASDPVNVIIGDPCLYGKFRLEPQEHSNDEFHILCNGSLLVPFQSSHLYGLGDYCLDTFIYSMQHEPVTLPLMCYHPEPPPPSALQKIAMAVYPVGLLLSVPFLLVTAVVYTAVSEVRDTQAKSLSCFCAILAVAFVSLATVQLFRSALSKTTCTTLAFVIQYTFLSSFVWLNILSIDTWWRLRGKFSWEPHREHIRFLWYSVYAMALPLVVTVVTMYVELTPIVPNAYLKPYFGAQPCWFKGHSVAAPYVYGPVTLLLIVDIWVFCAGLGYVRAAVEEEHGLYSQVSDNTTTLKVEMFKRYLILFLVIGLNWMLELVSFVAGGPLQACVVTDTLNTLQGVAIYFVFVVQVPHVRRLVSSLVYGAALPSTKSTYPETTAWSH